jgi:hypothetical protein
MGPGWLCSGMTHQLHLHDVLMSVSNNAVLAVANCCSVGPVARPMLNLDTTVLLADS